MISRYYEGRVRHRRWTPQRHVFSYRIGMAYLDLAELREMLSATGWRKGRSLRRAFRREDHLGDPDADLESCVRQLVEERLGWRPDGPIRLLTNLRAFGFRMNPVSFFYCFDRTDSRLETLVAEVTNTPWDERHCYVLDLRGGTSTRRRSVEHVKEFHVSPFLGMDMRYAWRVSPPGEQLSVHVENWGENGRLFDATLTMRRTRFEPSQRLRLAIHRPFATQRIFAGIYWQALRLWWKGVAYVPHPDRRIVKVS